MVGDNVSSESRVCEMTLFISFGVRVVGSYLAVHEGLERGVSLACV